LSNICYAGDCKTTVDFVNFTDVSIFKIKSNLIYLLKFTLTMTSIQVIH